MDLLDDLYLLPQEPMYTCLTADAYTEGLPKPVYVPELLLDVLDSRSNGYISDDEDDNSLLAPSSWAAKPTAADGTVPPSTSLDLDM